MSLPQIKESVIATMIDGDDPPYDVTVLIDTRLTETYDASFLQLVGFAQWLRGVFEPRGSLLPIMILVDDGWKFGMSHMFAMAAASVGGIEVRLCATEAAMMSACGTETQTLEDLFRPEHLYYRSAPRNGSIAV